MADSEGDNDGFTIVTDNDFAKYPLQSPRHLWKPLGRTRNIRLLKIFPARNEATQHEETIQSRLETWDLSEAKGKYEALSYAWGEKGNGFAFIQCDNVTTKIWRNLHQALLQLRRNISRGNIRQTKLIWVDALCIDQTDMQERQAQILLMKDIFGYASQVLIWLGEHDKASRQVWDSTKGALPGSPQEVIRNAIQWNVKMREDFIRRPWFRRVWTLQEVVLSRKATIRCGDSEMDWTLFCTIWKDRYEFMKNLKPEIREGRVDHIEESLAFIGLMHCFDIQQQLCGNNGSEPTKTLPLSEIIIRTWYRDATEAHDRIYALLGLVDINEYAGLEKPNYSQSPLELFVEVTKTAMRVDKTPALLNIAGLSPEDMGSEISSSDANATSGSPETNSGQNVRRPSWVPDWSKQGWENTWLTGRIASDDSNARIHPESGTPSPWGPTTWLPIFEDNKLHIRGHIIGYLPRRYIVEGDLTRHSDAARFKVEAMSWGSTGALRWVNHERSLKRNNQYSIPWSGLPYDGDTTREGDVVCALEGLRSLFLLRMLFNFDFGTWGALEWLKEDVQYRGLELNCLLIGPIHIDGVELAENPSLKDGNWKFIIS